MIQDIDRSFWSRVRRWVAKWAIALVLLICAVAMFAALDAMMYATAERWHAYTADRLTDERCR